MHNIALVVLGVCCVLLGVAVDRLKLRIRYLEGQCRELRAQTRKHATRWRVVPLSQKAGEWGAAKRSRSDRLH